MAGTINQEEAQWLRDAISAKRGDDEQNLAKDLLERKAITVEQWRAQVRQSQSIVAAVVVDPIAEKIAPWLANRTINDAEAKWLRASLMGEKGEAEKTLAAEFIDLKTRTVGQWRAKTTFSYALKDDAVINPAELPPAIDLYLSATTYVRLLLVSGGEFLRGSPSSPKEIGRLGTESEPVLTKINAPYYIGVSEVTQLQFESVMPKQSKSYWRFNIPNATKGGPEWPIDSIDWGIVNPASKTGFFAVLNRTLAGKYGGLIVADLPSEEEWEYACRAGTQTAFNNGKSITNATTDKALDELANYNRTNNGHPEPVRSYAPNAWGLYDMHGNVAEWCSNRAIRGGSWQSNAAGCRAAWRAQISQEAGPDNKLGFRLVLRYKKSGNP
jgi:formylglycine-generating enzyme required for sulfatase activity